MPTNRHHVPSSEIRTLVFSGLLLTPVACGSDAGGVTIASDAPALTTCGAGSTAEIIPTFPAASCPTTAYTTRAGLAYAPGDGHLLDLYLPTAGTGPFPTVVWIHGGGWRSGDRSQVAQAIRLVCSGYAVASIDYRLSSTTTQFPVQIHDVKAAVRYLRAQASTLDLDPERIALFGSSAGGHLAAVAGMSSGVGDLEDLSMGNAGVSSRVQAVVDWYGPTDFSAMDAQLAVQVPSCQGGGHGLASSPEGQLLGCAPSAASCASRVASADPEGYVDAADPPVLVMHGTRDCTVPLAGSRAFYDALASRGVCAWFRTVKDAGHGGNAWTSLEAQDEVARFLGAALTEATAPPPTTAQVNCSGLLVTGDARSAAGAKWTYASTDAGITYRLEGVLFLPQQGTSPFPGVVINHGKGGSPYSYSASIGNVMRSWGMAAIGPMLTHALSDTAANTPDGNEGASDANALRAHKARDLLSCIGADLTRVAVHGHSMGAFATGHLLGKYPSDFLAASHTAGGVGLGAATKSEVAALIRTPYQLHHGTGDRTVAYSADVTLANVLTSSGVANELVAYDFPPNPAIQGDRYHVLIAQDTTMLSRVQAWYREHGVLP